jgi:hypothetical protein
MRRRQGGELRQPANKVCALHRRKRAGGMRGMASGIFIV